jgi:hypothetical protein
VNKSLGKALPLSGKNPFCAISRHTLSRISLFSTFVTLFLPKNRPIACRNMCKRYAGFRPKFGLSLLGFVMDFRSRFPELPHTQGVLDEKDTILSNSTKCHFRTVPTKFVAA